MTATISSSTLTLKSLGFSQSRNACNSQAPASVKFAHSSSLLANGECLASVGSRNNGFSTNLVSKVNKTSYNCRFLVLAAQEVRTEQKVRVVLGPYKDGAIKVESPAPKVSSEEVEKALKEKMSKKTVLERTNFTGSGAKLGHTVKVSFEGKYLEGPNAGQLVKGTKANNFELDLKKRDDEPWKTFVNEIIKAGMGQEESKTFIVQFPENYKAPSLAGVKARFTLTVHQIGIKKAVEEDNRSIDVIRAEIEAEFLSVAERKSNEIIDAEIRNQLSNSSEADVEKVAASVTWAKFGEKSLSDFKWNVLQEEVARVENIPFDRVPSFLRENAAITYV